MRPLMLSGHERSLTQVKYNAPDGDLIFSCSKDKIINVWYSHSGERLGTFEGHNGTVWTTDCNSTSTLMVSGSADNEMKLWNVSNGKELFSWTFPTAVKRVAFSEDDAQVLCVTERRMGYPGNVQIFSIVEGSSTQNKEPILVIQPDSSRITLAAWTALDKHIVTTHEDGSLTLFDSKSGEEIKARSGVHEGVITDLQMSPDGTYFITSSKDKSAKIIDAETLDDIKTYSSETPLNSASVIPGRPYIIMGGGQEAMAVTTTGARQGHFEVRMCHKIFEEEVARIKGGFGPCNSLAVHPHGKGYALGGEDGYVRVHHFDPEFFTAKPYGTVDAHVEE